jgi:formylglycine-generating enzyme required for sulfatase activity
VTSPATSRLVGLLVIAALLLPACGPDESPEVEVPAWAHVAPEQIAEAKRHGVPVAFENDLGMRFVLIPAGTFLMGSPEDEERRREDETQHEVTISRPFYMQTTEMTNEQYRQLHPEHDSYLATGVRGLATGLTLNLPNQPVVYVSWIDAAKFSDQLSERDPRRSYRLPTEAQWEYACRAGTKSRFWWGSSEEEAGRYANVPDAAGQRAWRKQLGPSFKTDDGYVAAAPVATYRSNPWGLFDMLGNVSEWCNEWYGYYDPKPVTDPRGSPTTTLHVVRGGSCYPSADWFVSSAARERRIHGQKWERLGFRLVSPLPEPGER